MAVLVTELLDDQDQTGSFSASANENEKIIIAKKINAARFLIRFNITSSVIVGGIYYSEPNLSSNYICHVIPILLKPQELL